MRVVTNEALINRNKKIAQGLFAASLVLLAGGFLLANRVSKTEYAVYFQCVMVPLMFGIVIVSVRMTNIWVRPPHPWEAIRTALKGMSSETVLYNFILPAEHVLVSDSGVFVIETRFQERPQKVVDDKWVSSGGLLALMRQEQIGNPTQDALKKAARVEAFLRELIGDASIAVQPLIVFVHPNAVVDRQGEQGVPVLFIGEGDKKKKRKDSLKNYLKEAKSLNYPALTDGQIALLDDALLYKD